MPLQSQKGYELLYKGDTIYKPKPPRLTLPKTANVRRPRSNSPTGNDSNPGNSQRTSTSRRVKSLRRTRSLSPVKEARDYVGQEKSGKESISPSFSKSDTLDRLERPKLERPIIRVSTAINATNTAGIRALLPRSAICQATSRTRDEDISSHLQHSPYAVRQSVPPIKMFSNIPPIIKITKTLQGLRHSKKEPNRGS